MSDAEKIATMLLRDSLRARVVLFPFFGDDHTATIGGGFFQAGGFCIYETAQRREHLREARLQQAQELLGEIGIRHGEEMLSMRGDQSNRAESIAAKVNRRGLKTSTTA
jgi:hypothetical protein